MKYLIFCLLILPAVLSAEESNNEPETEQVTEEATTAETAPEAEQLKNRELGDAFRNFRPSEEITADNAVGFPVDI